MWGASWFRGVRLHRVANVSLAVALGPFSSSCGGGGDGGSAPNGDSAEEAAVPTSEQRDCVEASGVAEIAESFEFFGVLPMPPSR